MDEKQLISKIQGLRQIKPNKDWAVLAKKRILSEKEPASSPSFVEMMRFVFNHKSAFAGLISLIVLVGIFGFAQKSVPGDSLFAIKRATERGLAVFVPESEKAMFNLKQANKRIDDLVKVAESNNTRNLAPAINEYQATISEVAKSLTGEEDEETVKEMASAIRKLGEKEEKIRSLAVEMGENIELDSALVQTITAQVEDLKGRTLTEEQQGILAEIEENVENGAFAEALEKILFLGN